MRVAGMTVVAGLLWTFGAVPARSAPAPGAGVRSVRECGAAGDGKTLDTAAVQEAIDAASQEGGGTVRFPPGRYLSGTIFLKDGVTIELAAGATLLGSTDLGDFSAVVPKFRSYTDNYVRHSLIYGEGVRDVAIVGSGTIDGQGASFKGKPWLERPYLIRIVSSRNVTVEGITLRDSPMWVQHYLNCDFVTIRGITVLSHVNHNNDMLDIDCCRNVRIADCFGDSGDDAITLKSTAGRPCENVVVTNCVLFSTCNAIKLGTESHGGFKNVAITNCAIGPQRDEAGFFGDRMLAGIALEIVDGGALDGVAISNIAMRGVRVPIFMRLGNRARTYEEGMEAPGVGTFENVTVTNVVAEAVERIGCAIAGIPGHPIRGVSLSDVRLIFPGGGTAEEAARAIPEKPEAYPECTMFGVLPAYGFYCRHVEGLVLRNVAVGLRAGDARPALVCDDVRELEADGFSALRAPAGAPVAVLRDVAGALFRGCVAPEGASAFLGLEGGADRIGVLSSDLSRAVKPCVLKEDVDPGALFTEANRLPRD